MKKILLILVTILCTYLMANENTHLELRSVENDVLNLQNLHKYIYSQISSNQEIVFKQAILETGWLSSYNCKNKNNLFGLTSMSGYYKFNNWKESVLFYRDRIHKKYKSGDYYMFLERLGYAEDSLYVQKLKQIKVCI